MSRKKLYVEILEISGDFGDKKCLFITTNYDKGNLLSCKELALLTPYDKLTNATTSAYALTIFCL